MATDHTELCERLRTENSCDEGFYEHCTEAADLIESQAARIQQQAARIAELAKERDALKADAERYRWLRQDRTEDQTRAVIDIIIDSCDEYMDYAIDAALQAEKEKRS